MNSSHTESLVTNYAAPKDDMAYLYVNDRVARLYSASQTGEFTDQCVQLKKSQGWRFIFWNHSQCYGSAQCGAANN
jgi:hypothetical protein